MIKYTILKTKWGYFGLAATDNGLLRSYLPLAKRESVKSQLLRNFPNSRYDNSLFKKTQQQIIAYFNGVRVDFRNVPVELSGLGLFAKQVLKACRGIRFGQIVTYGRLAEMAGKPGTARAVGGVMAINPLPLIIPCHRVIRADGCLGGFSAHGGVYLKKKMLNLEAV
ncbi:MAG: methylated-DNA--[protein]-cysteine S-methyltransferase [Phycisphaerae bacterium]|nr:methylated-DNA--[protein]-cysteine S-methyltransferase [Phycisphaerae bacterium]MDD5380498.1 methylated-DNA--[protein]-cysteine S-methyltransferase [Phycisphaerae bacterium]